MLLVHLRLENKATVPLLPQAVPPFSPPGYSAWARMGSGCTLYRMGAAACVWELLSTLGRVETLDVLAAIALEGSPDAAAVRAEIARLTDQAMGGDLPFGEAPPPLCKGVWPLRTLGRSASPFQRPICP